MHRSSIIKDFKSTLVTKKGGLKSIAFVAFSSLIFSCSNDDTATPIVATPIPLECEIELNEALGFNAFIHNGVSLTSGDSDGPIAMGGDLTLNGLFTAAGHTAGTFYYEDDTEASSLIINGKINYIENEGIHLNNGYVKLGDLTGSVAHDIDDNNARNNTRITQGTYNDQPRVHVQRNQNTSTINVANIIDFDAAFEELNSSSVYYSELPNNLTLQEGNKISLLDDSFNVLHITGEELNGLVNFTFNNQPTATSPVIINIDVEEDFVWNVQNQAGIGDQHGAHIIFNFYNNQGVITMEEGGATVIGTVLAPNSHLIKATSGNINGQVIADSYDHLSGEIHQHVFNICDEDPCELVVNLGEDLFIDLGEALTLVASTNFEDVQFEWSTEEITQAIELAPIETTIYTVTAILENGCTTTDSITVNIGEDPCTSELFNVSAFTAIENLISFLNIDIAIDQDQLVNYATFDSEGTLVGLPVDVNLSEGCSTINLNLVDHFNFEADTLYSLVVTGNGWTQTIEFMIP